MRLILLLLIPSAAVAAPVTIENPSFEDDVLADGGFTDGVIDGWFTSPFAGVFNPTVASYAAIPDGVNVAYDRGVGIDQVLNTQLQPFTEYTLEVEIGNRVDGGFPDYRVQLLAGAAVLAEDFDTLSPASGTFETSVVTFSTGAVHPNLGDLLSIHLMTENVVDPAGQAGFFQVSFDDVRLTAVPVPEPSSLLLLLLGLGSLMLRRK